MHMLRTAVAAYQISSAATFNKLVYYFKKLPLIGKLVPVNIKTTGTLKEGLIVKKMASDVQQVSVCLLYTSRCV